MKTRRIVFFPAGCSAAVGDNATILEAAQRAGCGIKAECGGGGTCGKCRVRVDPEAPLIPPGPVEMQTIGLDGLASGFRLACQARVQGPLHVFIPPGTAASGQRLQVSGNAVPAGHDPPTAIHEITLGDETASASLFEQVTGYLKRRGLQPPGCTRPQVLKAIGRLLPLSGGSLKVGIRRDELRWVLPPGARALGLAIDVGTTKLAGYLLDLESGETLASGGKMNPQIAYGEDVVSRIAATIEDPAAMIRLQQTILSALGELASELCYVASRVDAHCAQLLPDRIVECSIVANTVMHHLLLGLPVARLGYAPFTPVTRVPFECAAAQLGLAVNENANIYLPPNVSGFIGSDHIAMLLSTGAIDREGTTAAIDIGTNTEISLISGGGIITCSTSSGPAFEGAHIQFGMRAAEGAIERVRIAGGKIEYSTIGNGSPVGFCGSGILDAVAQFRIAGIIDRHGTFDRHCPLVRRGDDGPEVLIVPAAKACHGKDLSISRKDIGKVQLAKAAIRTGLNMLLQQAGVSQREITQCVIAGGFGTWLNIDSAVSIGMFPGIAPERFVQVGNAAGMGAKLLLMSAKARKQASDLAESITHFELATMPSFQSELVRSLELCEGA
ncbi:MAG: ASKHA domain-containing protein [Desulfobacteraceae bacterium]|nr:ASKHA domain-containing protein [Desulfobacteraceae bacterium]